MTPKRLERPNHARALSALTGHALKPVYEALEWDRQEYVSNNAARLVEDVATSTQDSRYLIGDPQEDWVATSAIFSNALLMLIRCEQDAVKEEMG